MRHKDVYAVILAGGKGERLWPKSRVSFPKQRFELFGRSPIVKNALQRASHIAPGKIFIIASREVSSYLKKELTGRESARIIAEPFGRNTAPAIGLATLLASREYADAVQVIMPSDHLISDNKKFYDAIGAAVEDARKKGVVITLGIKPTSAETAYGYIGLDKKYSEISPGTSYGVKRFIEKPDLQLAERLVSDGRYLWNSGIFIFKTRTMFSLLRKHTPALFEGLTALPDLENRNSFDHQLRGLYKKLKSQSFDYAILEKTKDVRVIPVDFEWSDIGSFNSIARLISKDRDGNKISGSHVGIDTTDCVIFSEGDHLVGTVGIKDLIIVATPDATLACSRKRAEEVKRLVEKIRKNKKFSKCL